MGLANLLKRGPKKPKDPNAPTLGQVLRRDAIALVNWIFSTNEAGGRNRRWLLILIGALWWAWMGYQLYPRAAGVSMAAYPFQALFSAPVLRHVLVMLITFWTAISMTARYIDDVFELGDAEIAYHYIIQASVAGRYETIHIKDGKLASNPDSPVVKIGGPGLVKIHMDSAALFEKYDGTPNVFDASDGTVVLDRFERLRKTVSTRDHVDETDIVIRTKDGINVVADGVRIKYHIHRGGKQPTMQLPYPTSKAAVENLVYKENVFKRIEPKSHQPRQLGIGKMREHYEALELKSSYFQSKLKNIIAGATLNEFVARISQREAEKEQAEEQELGTTETREFPLERLPEDSDTGAKSPNGDDQSVTQTKRTESFYPRDEITQMIYNQNDEDDKLKSGLELDWIDIGTWEFPENAKHIAEQHREAWELSLQNIANKSESKLSELRREMDLETMILLMHELHQTPMPGSYGQTQKTIERMMRNYQTQFVRAAEYYQNRGKTPPEHLSKVIQYIDEYLKIQRFHFL